MKNKIDCDCWKLFGMPMHTIECPNHTDYKLYSGGTCGCRRCRRKESAIRIVAESIFYNGFSTGISYSRLPETRENNAEIDDRVENQIRKIKKLLEQLNK